MEGAENMLSYPLSRRMRKRLLLCSAFLIFCSCSFFKSKILPYPSGVIFPLERNGGVLYRGKINDVIQKKGNDLYLSTDRGIVYSIDGIERKIRWIFRVRQEFVSAPYLGENSVYVYDSQSTLYCIDMDGQLSWKKKIGEKITSGVKESQGRLYFGTEKGTLFSFDQKGGEELWRFQAGEAIHSMPALARGMVVFGCDDRHLYLLDLDGKIIDKFETGDKIQSVLLVDEKSVYFGSNDYYFYCFDLKRKRERWKVKTGCRVFASPIADKKRVLFLCWNGILYCLSKKNGTIVWWDTIHSRSFYSLEKIEDRVVVTSLSSLLVSYDIQTGRKIGEFESGQVIQSNPLWFEPYLLINLFDFQTGRGNLIFLKKAVKVELKPSLESPQKTGEEIRFAASTNGFFKANYEFNRYRLQKVDFNPAIFYLSILWEKELVQEKSEEDAWQWLPEVPGIYVVAVEVVDEKERARAMIPYVMEKEKPRVTIRASKESPQKPDQEIIFNAQAKGLKMPQYEFSLSRFLGADVHPTLFSFYLHWKTEVVQKASEEFSWTWIPEDTGTYLVSVKASGDKEQAEGQMGFLVEREKPKVSITPSLESPQEIRKKISFEAEATEIEEPKYEFFLSRLINVEFHPALFLFRTSWEQKEVQQASEKKTWDWRPRLPGVYTVTVRAAAENVEAESVVGFKIVMKPDRKARDLILFLIGFIKIFIPFMG